MSPAPGVSGDRDLRARHAQARKTDTTVRFELQSVDQPDDEAVARFGHAYEPSR